MMKRVCLLLVVMLAVFQTPVLPDSGESEHSCFDTDTKLMLHMDGTDASTTFTDSSDSAHSITANGDAQIDTAQSQFGGASALFDGTGDYLTMPDNADWNFGSGDFTIDFWVRFSAVSSSQTFVAHWPGNTSDKAWLVNWSDSSKNIQVFWTNNGSTNESISFSWDPSTDTWYHVAITRSGNDLKVFVDGTQVGSTGDLSGETFHNSSGDLWVAANLGGGGSATGFISGHMDEVRIVKGTAVWTSNFGVNNEAYTNGCPRNSFIGGSF